jgi:hypothetical protein
VKCGSEAQGGRLGPGVSHGLGRCRLQVAGEVRVATWPSNTSIYGNALSRAANAGSYKFHFVHNPNSLLQIVPLPSWQAVGAQPDVLCWKRSRLTVVAVSPNVNKFLAIRPPSIGKRATDEATHEGGLRSGDTARLCFMRAC